MENSTRLITVTFVALLAIAGGGSHASAQSGPPGSALRGAWKAVETGPAQNTNKVVGLAIFTDSHYSIMYFAAAFERPDVADISKATADEMRGLWNGWVANTGTYEVNGDLVTIHPMGAKIPVVMKPGANEVYRYRVEGTTLSWTQQRNARGVDVTNAQTTKFVREE